jgi:hypothetical protein
MQLFTMDEADYQKIIDMIANNGYTLKRISITSTTPIYTVLDAQGHKYHWFAEEILFWARRRKYIC